jgi:hypothetical protein
MNIESFKKAFTNNMGTCWATCNCGKVFFNPDNSWEWEKGEIEKLQSNPQATELDWSVVLSHLKVVDMYLTVVVGKKGLNK